MKRKHLLPLSALLLGLVCLWMRRTLYRTAVDATGLLIAGTGLEWGVYALTAAALIVFAAAAKRWETPDPIPAAATLGQLAGAVGFGWTALIFSGDMPGLLGTLWKLLGLLSGLCLLMTAWCTLKKKTPAFLVRLIPCLFWLVHMVDNYRGWSSQPQLQSYLFALLGAMAMTLFTYYTAAAAVGLGKPRLRVFSALSAGFTCMAAALPGKNQLLYLLCALWAVTGLFEPQPEKEA